MEAYSSVYNLLIEVAKAGKTTTYGEVGRLLGLNASDCHDQDEIARVLSDIALKENAEGRPLLSTVAVISEFGYPSKSFFQLAREIENYTFYDPRSFFATELKRVHEYWQQRKGEPLKQ